MGKVNLLVQAGNSAVNDLREFMKDWASLEKEYGQRLENMVKKYHKVKDKKLPSLSIGSTGKEGSGGAGGALGGSANEFNAELDSSTYVRAWDQMLRVTSIISDEHLALAEQMQNEVVEPARGLGQRKEEARKSHIAYCQYLLEQREKLYTEKDKRQTKYTEVAGQAQSLHSKFERSVADKSHDKTYRHYQKVLTEKNNQQNLYILSLAVANRIKAVYYRDDIPALMNQLQALNQSRILASRSLWTRWIDLQCQVLQKLQTHMSDLHNAVAMISPEADAELFISRNPASWSEPLDFHFVPLVHSSDRGEFVLDEDAQVFLTNWSAKQQHALADTQGQIEQVQLSLGELDESLSRADPSDPTGTFHLLLDKKLEVSRELMTLQWQQSVYSTEITEIGRVIGQPVGSNAHRFQSHTFAIPTTCDYCQGKIWGMGKNEKSCILCGYNVHKKCLLKVPIDCSGSVAALRRRRSLLRSGSQSSGSVAPNISRTPTYGDSESDAYGGRTPATTTHIGVAGLTEASPDESPLVDLSTGQTGTRHPPPPVPKSSKKRVSVASGGDGPPPSVVTAKALYDYRPTTSDALALRAGENLYVIQRDDGSGWTKAELNGKQGIVPSNYIQVLAGNSTSTPSAVKEGLLPTTPPPPFSASHTTAFPTARTSGGIGMQVKALFDFDARDMSELSFKADDIITVTNQRSHEGWMEGSLRGKTGQFPSNYVTVL
ncbi:Protein BZZ1 [Dispira parvispora]|uniref:Protein BZZ1 n=1 Tax=Dispira parvispora TaxID=1520584 RepID=A0A9W8AWU5_9FUNG|nr:Protein BZZ1 [Dispira parvispora]